MSFFFFSQFLRPVFCCFVHIQFFEFFGTFSLFYVTVFLLCHFVLSPSYFNSSGD